MKASASSKYAEPEPQDDDDINMKDLDLLAELKQARNQQIEDKKKMIDAMKSEYGELKDAKDLLFVSFDEPKEDRPPVTFDRNEYKVMLERLEQEKKELENPNAIRPSGEKKAPPAEPKSIRKVVYDSAIEKRRRPDGSIRPYTEEEL